jgi:hypothetical protein
VTKLFLEFSRTKLIEEYWPRLRGCVEPLPPDRVWWRPNEASNSIGNLILHLNGNVQQWLVASFNGLQDARDRPTEFSERQLIPASALLEKLGATMADASSVLGRLTETDLLATMHIQGHTVRRSRRGVPGGGAFRNALRADSFHHQAGAWREFGILPPTG